MTGARADVRIAPHTGELDVLLGERASHPLTALIGVPNAATRTADATGRWVLDYGNAFMGGRSADESLLLDGETLRLNARWQRSLRSCWSSGIEAGLVVHHGGTTDVAIERWHDAFGLPNAGRDGAPRNALLFAYERFGREGLQPLSEPTAGLADTQLWLQRTLGCGAGHPDRQAIVRTGIKLPTGRLRDWSGSGAPDVWLDVQSAVYEPLPGVRLGASVGVLAPGRTARLPGLRSAVGFGALGVRYRADPRVALHAMIDWNTPLLHSDLAELGAGAVSLATGFSFAPGRRSRIDVQILEDVLIDSASDIRLRIALTLRP